MEEWKKVSLREATDIIGDGLHGTPLYSSDGEFAFVNGNNLSDGAVEIKADTKMCDLSEYEKYKKDLSDRTLFLSINGTIGNTAKYSGEKIILGKSACYLNVKKDYNLDFLYYVLRTPAFQSAISGLATGTTIKNVSLKTIREYEFSVPDYEGQTRIARILRAIDDKIELNKRINHNLEQQAQALYKSWFVDFEPFKDEEFVDSELGMIPEGWRVGTLGELLEIRYGKDHKKLSDGPYPVYGSGGLMRKVERPLFEGESVLIPRKGSLNNVMYVNEAFWSVDTMFFSVERMPNVVKYSYQILSQLDLASMNSGSAVPSMTTDILNAIQVVIPDKKVLENYNIILSRFFSSVASIRNESCRLVDIRNSILPKLMNGEILC